jgi:hypothetical protein
LAALSLASKVMMQAAMMRKPRWEKILSSILIIKFTFLTIGVSLTPQCPWRQVRLRIDCSVHISANRRIVQMDYHNLVHISANRCLTFHAHKECVDNLSNSNAIPIRKGERGKLFRIINACHLNPIRHGILGLKLSFWSGKIV